MGEIGKISDCGGRRLGTSLKRFVVLALAIQFVFMSIYTQYVSASISKDTESVFRLGIHEAVSDTPVGLTSAQIDRVAEEVLRICRESSFQYTEAHMPSLLESLRLTVSRWDWGDDGRSHPELQSLLFEQKVMRFESYLPTFEVLSAGKTGVSAGPKNVERYVGILNEAVEAHFANVPTEVRTAVLEEFRARWLENQRNLFTNSGKRELDTAVLEQISHSLSRRAEEAAKRLSEETRTTPDELAPSLAQQYLRQLFSHASRLFSRHTRAPVLNYISEDTLERLKEVNIQMHKLSEEASEIRMQLQHAEVARKEQEFKRYIEEERLRSLLGKDVGEIQKELVSDIQQMALEGVSSETAEDKSLGELAETSLAERKTAPAEETTPPDNEHDARVKPISKTVLTVLLIVIIAGCWMAVRIIHKRRTKRKTICLLFSLCLAFGSKVQAAEVTEHPVFRLAEQAGLSEQLVEEWKGYVENDIKAEATLISESLLEKIEPALLDALRKLEQSSSPIEQKRVLLSSLADIAVVASKMCQTESEFREQCDRIKQFYRSLFSFLAIPDFGRSRWETSVDRIFEDEIANDPFLPLFAALWTPHLSEKVTEEWARYCSKQVPTILRGYRYGQRVSGNMELQGNENVLVDALVRKAFSKWHLVLNREVISERTRSLQRAFRARMFQTPDLLSGGLVASGDSAVRSFRVRDAWLHILFMQSLLPAARESRVRGPPFGE